MNEYPSSSIPAHKKIFSPIEEEAGDNSGARNDEKKGNVSRFTITGGGAREEEGDERGGDVTHKPSDQSGVIIDGNSPIKDKNFRRGQSMGSLDEHIHLASSKAGTETYRDEKQQMPYRQQPVSFQSPAPRVGQGGSGFNPSVPAFKPSAPEFQPVEVTHDNAPGRPRHSGPPVSMGTLGMGGKSRLPVFSQLQAVDSGSDRGSSRRSDRSSPTNSIDSMTNSIDSMHTDGKVAPRMLIRELTQKMGSKDESKAAAAAKKVFDIVRESCPSWRQNQTEICRSPEMLMTLAALLRAGSERCR